MKAHHGGSVVIVAEKRKKVEVAERLTSFLMRNKVREDPLRRDQDPHVCLHHSYLTFLCLKDDNLSV